MAKKEYSCRNPKCDNTFTAYPSRGKKYCTHKCSVEVNKKDLPSIKCVECKNELLHRQKIKFLHSNRKGVSERPFCSKKCRGRYYNTKERRFCYFCGQPFRVRKKSNKRYCSKDHGNKGKANKLFKVCSYFECNKVFRVMPDQDKYCSIKCISLDKRSELSKRIPDNVLVHGNHHKYLTDRYIIDIIKQSVPSINDEEIPKSLINTKRTHIKLQREIKQIKQ